MLFMCIVCPTRAGENLADYQSKAIGTPVIRMRGGEPLALCQRIPTRWFCHSTTAAQLSLARPDALVLRSVQALMCGATPLRFGPNAPYRLSTYILIFLAFVKAFEFLHQIA